MGTLYIEKLGPGDREKLKRFINTVGASMGITPKDDGTEWAQVHCKTLLDEDLLKKWEAFEK